MNDLETIAHCRRELRADARSLRFVPLAEALRRVGRTTEAEGVLADGLLLHPDLNSARLVLARVYTDTGRRAEALSILDDLYPRDTGNVSLVSLYLELLVDAGRSDEARVLLDRAELVGVPAPVRQRVREQLEADLWAATEAMAPVVTPVAAEPSALRRALSEPVTLPDTSLAEFGDRFAIPAVAMRLERAGRLQAALRIWEEMSLLRPANAEIDRRINAIRFASQPSAAPLDDMNVMPTRPAPGPAGVRALRRLLIALGPAAGQRSA